MTARTGADARPIYLDHHATTPVDPRVVEVMTEAMLTGFGNPNSAHAFGREAAGRIHRAAVETARLVGADEDDVRFTTGASEALNLALNLAAGRIGGRPLRVTASRIEHSALLGALTAAVLAGWAEVAWMDPDHAGRISEAEIARGLAGSPDLVCLMAANNEVGVIQPFEAAARAAHAVGAAILIDATQAAGWVAINQAELQADYLVLSAHKIYGPKGVGALIGPDVGAVEPRADSHVSTPNTPGIVGMGEACRLRRLEKGDDGTRVAALRDRLQDRLVAGIPGLVVNGDLSLRLPYSLHISVPYVPNDVMVDNLLDTVALSTGAACMSGVDAPSHVLSAMRLEDWRVAGALRLSLGRSTTLAEVDSAADAIVAVVARLTPLFRNAA